MGIQDQTEVDVLHKGAIPKGNGTGHRRTAWGCVGCCNEHWNGPTDKGSDLVTRQVPFFQTE